MPVQSSPKMCVPYDRLTDSVILPSPDVETRWPYAEFVGLFVGGSNPDDPTNKGKQ